MVVIGVVRRCSCFLLPWLAWHVVMVLACLGSGLYILVHFLLLVEERAEEKAVLGAAPLLAGVFLIFLWVLVDQLYIQLRQTQLTIEVENPLSKSTSNLTMSTRHTTSTLRSTRSQHSLRSLRPAKKRSHLRRQEDGRKSRSLEHILDSSSYSSNSSYQSENISCKLQGLTTLPRLRRCPDNPDTFSAYMVSSNYAGNTDTIRSCKSVTSGKSVFIHPQVVEYHYDHHEEAKEIGNEEGVDEATIDFSDDADDSLNMEEILTDTQTLPPPIYPSLESRKSWNGKFHENRKIFTKDQIIDFYCPPDIKIV